ncbi:MAG: ribulose-phosphate 3-epimerase [Saprospiraceae bacterium]|nr:ribulose-phosphate 3-epimerase [Saprospiraceae bacterium]
MSNHLIAPSVLSANFKHLQESFDLVNNSEADWFHVDIMDGKFVPNISFGMSIVGVMKEMAKKPLDVHLMIVEPERYIDWFRKVGADIITVHYEACIHLHRTIEQIKASGAKVGVALNPHTPVSLLTDIIQEIDLVLVMSVNPGFGGQSFITNTYNKVIELKNLITRKDAHALIEIDGGVGKDNAEQLLRCGADVLVAGSSVFGAKDPTNMIATLKQIDIQSSII